MGMQPMWAFPGIDLHKPSRVQLAILPFHYWPYVHHLRQRTFQVEILLKPLGYLVPVIH